MKTIGDEQLKAYFLGSLTEPEAEYLEIECASSAELSEQAQTVERELTDDYLRGNLSNADIRLYETNYLITRARHKKFQAAAMLWKISNEPAPPSINPVASASPTPFWQTLFGKRRVLALAFGGLCLLTFGVAAFYLLTLNADKTELAGVTDPAQPPKIESPEVQNPDNQTIQNAPPENQDPKSGSTNQRAQNEEAAKNLTSPPKDPPETKAASSPKPVEPTKPVILMTVKLFPGSLRDESGEQSVTIAPKVKSLKLLLSPAGEPNNYKIYRAVVKTPENNTVFTSPNLKSLSFTIPAEKLENRTYIISLEGQNPQKEFESIADYTVRIRR